jgi:Ca2+-binding EF-hand superfamily protein
MRIIDGVALACLALAFAASGAQAATDATPADQSLVMSKIDADHDGTISKEEAKAAADAKFAALDTDHEATLDATELTGIVSSKSLAKADLDNDKTLDQAEYEAYVMKLFDAADSDHDGTLAPKELGSEPGRALIASLEY